MSTRLAWSTIPSATARSTRCGRCRTAWCRHPGPNQEAADLERQPPRRQEHAQADRRNGEEPGGQEQAPEKLATLRVDQAGHPQGTSQGEGQQSDNVEQPIRKTADEQTGLGTGFVHGHAGSDHIAADQRDEECRRRSKPA